jgi:hypothetical protein
VITIHSSTPPPFARPPSCVNSQARANCKSRCNVPGEVSNTSLISLSVIPAKKPSSTAHAVRWSSRSSHSRALIKFNAVFLAISYTPAHIRQREPDRATGTLVRPDLVRMAH